MQSESWGRMSGVVNTWLDRHKGLNLKKSNHSGLYPSLIWVTDMSINSTLVFVTTSALKKLSTSGARNRDVMYLQRRNVFTFQIWFLIRIKYFSLSFYFTLSSHQFRKWLTLLTLLMWRIGWAPNSIPIYVYIQKDAMLHRIFISGNGSKFFGWHFHPSSGEHTTVSTASGICHTVTAICCYQLEPVWVCCGWRTPPTAHSYGFQLIAADSSNGVTNTRCCRYGCMLSW
jgi:hypothetical protein